MADSRHRKHDARHRLPHLSRSHVTLKGDFCTALYTATDSIESGRFQDADGRSKDPGVPPGKLIINIDGTISSINGTRPNWVAGLTIF